MLVVVAEEECVEEPLREEDEAVDTDFALELEVEEGRLRARRSLSTAEVTVAVVGEAEAAKTTVSRDVGLLDAD